jgi:hypothetical protein
MEIIGPVVVISEAIFTSPSFGKAFDRGSTETVGKLIALQQTVLEAYYGRLSLAHHIDFPPSRST